MIDRNSIYDALLALTNGLTWLDERGDPASFAVRTRNPAAWDKATQSALVQFEISEHTNQAGNTPLITRLMPKWVIYFSANLGDPTVDANAASNRIVDAAMSVLEFEGGLGFMNTLGGLVHRCYPSGGIVKEPAYNSGQLAVAIPITIIVP